MWIFVWDDEAEMHVSTNSGNTDQAQEYCNATLEFLSYAMDTRPTRTERMSAMEDRWPCLSLLWDIGTALADEGTAGILSPSSFSASKTDILEQRHRFLREIENYIQNIVYEQNNLAHGNLPGTAEYMDLRMGTIAAKPFGALAEYVIYNTLVYPS